MNSQEVPPKRLAVILLKLPDGRIATQRRTLDAPTAPGKLGFFGGHIDGDEDPDVCIRRELAEETSLDVSSIDIRFVTEKLLPATPNSDGDRHFYIYEADIESPNFDVFEGVGAEFYTPEDLRARDDASPLVAAFMETYAS